MENVIENVLAQAFTEVGEGTIRGGLEEKVPLEGALRKLKPQSRAL
jgi:hypothetical protein